MVSSVGIVCTSKDGLRLPGIDCVVLSTVLYAVRSMVGGSIEGCRIRWSGEVPIGELEMVDP